VNLRVRGDRNSRIRAAFAETLTQAGLKTGDSDSRYTLKVTVIIEPGTVGRYFSAAYTVTAVLKDNRTDAGLFSYSDTERHPAGRIDAENRALLAAVQSITGEFLQVLQEYSARD
jgi:hypothetical protein